MKLPTKPGIGANHGAMAKPLNTGLAAQNGVPAAAAHEMVNAGPAMPVTTLQPPD